MSKSYSMEMRERVIRDVGRGQTVRAVAARFEVSIASVVRWSGLSRTNPEIAYVIRSLVRGPTTTATASLGSVCRLK
jgi:transposase